MIDLIIAYFVILSITLMVYTFVMTQQNFLMLSLILGAVSIVAVGLRVMYIKKKFEQGDAKPVEVKVEEEEATPVKVTRKAASSGRKSARASKDSLMDVLASIQ